MFTHPEMIFMMATEARHGIVHEVEDHRARRRHRRAGLGTRLRARLRAGGRRATAQSGSGSSLAACVPAGPRARS
ncbi:hypothetical protein JQS43_16310 [Natronosporangium hydrolyticum]|uniref:Uncharacterized protein n=1 Tax=Natronosporangium hydrolyticum TaxID=2811111 RepID=A0A895YG75_9ACTN|nr:hypothetical protein [Natronosporangium hydrolyticum]QSB13190.1 hypothetical protein JQS43_16310 [Natronosporangium hydrolyticum]